MAVTRSRRKAALLDPTIIAPTEYLPGSQLRRSSKLTDRRNDPRRSRVIHQPLGLPFMLQPASFGLMQERILTSLYALLIQSILWNQTHGLQARPILFKILTLYPTAAALSLAPVEILSQLLQPIGLQNIRAARLIAFGKTWVEAPPCATRRYRKLNYPTRGSGKNIRPGEILATDDARQGWEVAHLPGMGPYALDSYRIFYRDQLRDLEGREGVEPEWMRVVPGDKDLSAYLVWKWQQYGWDWDAHTGKRTLMTASKIREETD